MYEYFSSSALNKPFSHWYVGFWSKTKMLFLVDVLIQANQMHFFHLDEILMQLSIDDSPMGHMQFGYDLFLLAWSSCGYK